VKSTKKPGRSRVPQLVCYNIIRAMYFRFVAYMDKWTCTVFDYLSFSICAFLSVLGWTSGGTVVVHFNGSPD